MVSGFVIAPPTTWPASQPHVLKTHKHMLWLQASRALLLLPFMTSGSFLLNLLGSQLPPWWHHCPLHSNRWRRQHRDDSFHEGLPGRLWGSWRQRLPRSHFAASSRALGTCCYRAAGRPPASDLPAPPQTGVSGVHTSETRRRLLCDLWKLLLSAAQTRYEYWIIVQSANSVPIGKDQEALVQMGWRPPIQGTPKATCRGSAWRQLPSTATGERHTPSKHQSWASDLPDTGRRAGRNSWD